MKKFFKKHLNKIMLLLIILNFLIIYFILIRPYNKNTVIKLDSGNLVSEIKIDYEVQGNPLSKIEIKDLTNTEAEINECVGNAGQSIDISGNFFNFQLKEATVTMKYDKEKLNDVNEENLGVLWYDDDRDEMIVMDSSVDIENGTIEFKTEHFSEYIIVDLETWEAAWNQRVVRVRNDADAFDISFVIDDSGSMTSNDPQDLRIEAVENFIDILRNQDNYSIIKFESSANTIKELKDELSEDWKDDFRSSGGTNITNGVSSGITTLSEENGNYKVLVLLTDGEDAGLSSKKEEIISDAIDKNITIYTIFLNTGYNTNQNNTQDISDIALETGGSFYTISTDEIIDIFKQISKVSIGVDGSVDTDGDGIPDEIELGGMRNKYGKIVYTNPYNADTDGDGKSDKEEVGEVAETWITKQQYYKMPSDPTRANERSILYSAQGPNREKALGVWDSGFKLNKNAFQFENLSVKGTAGVCNGIAYITERIYNGEEIPKSGMETVSVNYPFSVDQYNRTRALIIESLKGDRSVAYEDVTNSDGTVDNSKIRIFYDIDSYNITDPALDIVFEKALPYFYYPPTTELKYYMDTDYLNNKIINETFLKTNSADAQLVDSIFYYWALDNKNTISMLVEKLNAGTYEIDIQNQVTEDTIQNLKLLFNNKKIVTIQARDKAHHAINAYALEQKSETLYRLYVYDNQSPYMFKNNNYIEFIKIPGTDRYDIDSYLITTNDKPEDGSDDGRERTFIIEYNGDYINFNDEPLELD